MRNTAIGLIVLGIVGSTAAWAAPASQAVTPQDVDEKHRASVRCFDGSVTSRFADCGDGTVQDVQTGLLWLKNANCFGLINWWDATAAAAALGSGQCGLTDGSLAGAWRLPTLEEWTAMLMPSCYPFPGGPTIPDKTGSACYLTGIPWATNAQSNVYWSSTSNANSPGDAWAMDLFSREVNGGTKTFRLYVWPLRSAR
jgi:uncharacterized protein DUF1566